MSLIAHYRLDDNAASTVVLDSSGSGFHGVAARNTNLTYAVGKIGGALNFNGTTDVVSIAPVSFSSANGNPFTVAYWVKIANFTANPWPAPVTLKDSNSLYAWTSGISNQGGYTGLYFGGQDLSGFARRKSNTSAATFVGAWNHVAITYNGNGMATPANFLCYLNGGLVSTTAASTFSASTNITALGFSGTLSCRLTGLLDDVRIYNTALSAPEVLAVYRLGKLALKAGSQYLTLSIT
jgi:hypothetical protein